MAKSAKCHIDIQWTPHTESRPPNVPPVLDVAVKFLDLWQFVFQHFQVYIRAKGMVDARENDEQRNLAM